MHKRKKLLAVLLLPLICFLGACSSTPDAAAAPPTAAAAAEETAASTDGLFAGSFTAQEFDGDEVTESIFSDAKLSLVNVWATWCGPCLGELPALESVYRQEAGPDFQVIGIVSDLYDPATGGVDTEAFETAEMIKGRLDLTFPNLVPDSVLYENVISTVYGFPTTYFVDSAGKVVGDPVVGAMSEEEWQKMVVSKLAEVGA